jgi:two-component system, OmpR family, sensor kinase
VSLVQRLSIRARVTLAFSAVIAVVLAGTGLFVYLRMGTTLSQSVDRSLSGRADDIAAVLRQSRPRAPDRAAGSLLERPRDLAQILDPAGHVADGSASLGSRPLLSAGELARARVGELHATHDRPRFDGDGVRVYARPVIAAGRRYVVAVATAVEPSEDAHHDLGGALLVGGPAALALAALAGYGATAASLAPVERMRRRASSIGARDTDRLPVPPSGDEVARLGRTLNEMLERLHAAYEHERGFVDDASHELRTPLSILKGELELALRDAWTLEEARAAMTSAAEETDRLVALAEDLLVIARADQGELPIRPTAVDVGALLESSAGRFAGRAREAGARVDVEVSPGLKVRGDERLLGQALDGLVDNALRHGAGSVTVTAEARPGVLALVVRDDGEGFGPEIADRAFERFSRGDTARGRGGTGLGLAIVAAIAEAHGGGAFAGNRPGGGAEVGLELSSGSHGAPED